MDDLYGRRSGRSFQTFKLMVAVGHMSVPNMPLLRNQEQLQRYVGHHERSSEASLNVLPSSKRVAVLGGGKLALDMVWVCMNMLRREMKFIGSYGKVERPALFFPAPAKDSKCQDSVERSATRYRACFDPSSFMPRGILAWLSRLFHELQYGVDYMAKKAEANDGHCYALAAYQAKKDI